MKKEPLDYIKEYFDGRDTQLYEGAELKHFNKYCHRAEEMIESFKAGAKKRAPKAKIRMKEKWSNLRKEDRDKWVINMVQGRSSVSPQFVSGKYFSKKNDSFITFQSSYELLKLIEWENDIKVQSYGRCDFFLHYEHKGELKRYFPDYFKKLGNKITVVEIKPKYALVDEVVITKLNHLQSYCKENNFDMEIATEDSLKIDIDFSNEVVIFYRKNHQERLKRTLESLNKGTK